MVEVLARAVGKALGFSWCEPRTGGVGNGATRRDQRPALPLRAAARSNYPPSESLPEEVPGAAQDRRTGGTSHQGFSRLLTPSPDYSSDMTIKASVIV